MTGKEGKNEAGFQIGVYIKFCKYERKVKHTTTLETCQDLWIEVNVHWLVMHLMLQRYYHENYRTVEIMSEVVVHPLQSIQWPTPWKKCKRDKIQTYIPRSKRKWASGPSSTAVQSATGQWSWAATGSHSVTWRLRRTRRWCKGDKGVHALGREPGDEEHERLIKKGNLKQI